MEHREKRPHNMGFASGGMTCLALRLESFKYCSLARGETSCENAWVKFPCVTRLVASILYQATIYAFDLFKYETGNEYRLYWKKHE